MSHVTLGQCLASWSQDSHPSSGGWVDLGWTSASCPACRSPAQRPLESRGGTGESAQGPGEILLFFRGMGDVSQANRMAHSQPVQVSVVMIACHQVSGPAIVSVQRSA